MEDLSPIQEPKGTYKNGPPERLPEKCPNCGIVLEHFKLGKAPALPSPPAPKPADSLLKPVDLFRSQPSLAPTTPITSPTEEPLPSPEVGDLYIPEPAFTRKPEQQIAKEKAKKQTIRPEPAATPPRPIEHPNAKGLQLLDDSTIGSKVTICVLLFGDYPDLARRCLNSIVETVPPSRMDLRVACNQVCLETTNYLKALPISKIYPDTKSRRKYQAMRQIFYDEKHPIETKWTIWFDDDSYCRHPEWLVLLTDTIVKLKPADNVAMLGVKMIHPLRTAQRNRDPRTWFKNGEWFKNRPFRTRQGQPAPNGAFIHFIVGGFWALRTDSIRICDIPDKRLNHNGGDICVGEQLWQNGFQIKQFNRNKAFIHTSAHPRRGHHEKFLWM